MLTPGASRVSCEELFENEATWSLLVVAPTLIALPIQAG
jgi:hypothetical protein